MKQLTCEMCGSTDLLKQDGVFVCQACGTKYSVEEAKKMMVEGTVDVSGSTVKVDTSDELSNLYQIARRARDDNNAENAAKYYNMILIKDPFSWEASFFLIYFQAMSCKIGQIEAAAISVKNCEQSVLGLIHDHLPSEDQVSAVMQVVFHSNVIAKVLADNAKTHYNGIDSSIKSQYTHEYISNTCESINIMYTCGNYIEQIWGDDSNISPFAAEAWKCAIEIHSTVISLLSVNASKKEKNTIASYAQKIGKFDPTYLKRYLNSEEITQLQKSISKLQVTIGDLNERLQWKAKDWINAGIEVIFSGIMLPLILAWLFSSDTPLLLILPIVLYGISYFIPYFRNIREERNRESLKATKKELAEKQKKLDKLLN